MAGMLPGVECARRRRLRQGGSSSAEAAGFTRRSSFCLYTNGHGAHLVGTSNPGKQRGGVMEIIHGWTLNSNAREAKERLDQKLRSQREIKRHHSTGSITLGRTQGTSGDDGGGGCMGLAGMGSVQREVYSNKGVVRRFSWSRLRWEAAELAECAVCLEEFTAGDVLAHLPCGHRFHWGCAAPWLEATSRCPFCRAVASSTA